MKHGTESDHGGLFAHAEQNRRVFISIVVPRFVVKLTKD